MTTTAAPPAFRPDATGRPVPEIFYPESDGKPLAENTLQYEWIEKLKGNIDAVFAGNPEVFVAADNIWYPVQNRPDIFVAPDVYVVFGRPKGHRGSYRQWDEGGIAPQVVFEIWSPGNTRGEIADKLAFYEQYGVEEYYTYDPEPRRPEFAAWVRGDGEFERVIVPAEGFVSPRLGVRFEIANRELTVYRPGGEPFKGMVELDQERQRFRDESERLLVERDSERQRVEELTDQNARLLAQLRALGVEPQG